MPPAYEVLLLNTAIPQIQAAQSGDTYVVPRDIAINATAIISANSATDALRITQTGAGNAILVEDSANPDSTPFVVTAAGDVGIGTSSPSTKLDVVVADAATASKWIASTGRLRLRPYTDATSGAIFESTNSAENAYLPLSIFGSTVRLGNGAQAIIDSSGNLGLGVTPSAWYTSYGTKALQFAASGSLHGLDVSNSDRRVALANNDFINTSGVDTYINTGHATKLQQVAGQFQFFTAPSGNANDPITFTQAMTLDASGNLLVGTTSTSGLITGQFQLGTTSAATAGIQILNSTTGVGGIYFGDSTTGNARFRGMVEYNHTADALILSTAETERARITSGGDLAIGRQSNIGGARVSGETGTGNPTYAAYLPTTGTETAFLFVNPNGTVGSITTNGSATAYNTSSDYRLKDNPQPLTGSGAFIDALQPKTWDWKSGGKGVGFIAHEVQEVSPGSVVGEKDAVDADGKPIMQAMEYGSAEFIANIIAELQSLRARVKALEGA